MSKQRTLDGYFNKSKNTGDMSDQNFNKKRRSLSLIKPTTPKKATKPNHTGDVTEIIEVLSSDDEREHASLSKDRSNDNSSPCEASNSSESTIVYGLTPSTPKKSPKASPNNSFRSPTSGQKYYSPVKKRAVLKKPTTIRNLRKEFGSPLSRSVSFDGDEFSKACEGMDDKSIFLLTIINNFLKNENLKKLLSEESVDLLSRCFHLVKPGARLLCRLYWYQRKWYRREKLVNIVADKTGDIGDPQIAEMLNCLLENGFITLIVDNTMTFDDYTKILKAVDIKQICKDLKIKIKSKENGVQALQNFSRRESIGKFFNGASANNHSRVIEIYFKAHLIYEEYLIEKETSEKCTMVKKVCKLYQEISKEDMSRYESLPTWLRRYTPAYIYVKMLESGIKELKKDKHYLFALDILTMLIAQKGFRQHKKGEWYAEKALVLHSLLSRHDEAAEVLLEGLKSNLTEEAKAEMRPRAIKIANQKNIKISSELSKELNKRASEGQILEKSFKANHIHKQEMETLKNRGKKKFEIHTENGKHFLEVEDFCLLDYTNKGDYTHGGHWEGRIVTTIYFLLFWDIIYMKPRGARGVFLSHYQKYPLDMYCDEFYDTRKTEIEDRLREIENMDTNTLIETLKHKWDERPECELSGICWSVGWESVRGVCRCVSARAAAALCRRVAAQYKRHSGFPDLTLWNVHTGQVMFVEVKSDTDKPSLQQLQWMQYLRDNNIRAEFCYVGVQTTRHRARARPALAIRTVADINGQGASNN